MQKHVTRKHLSYRDAIRLRDENKPLASRADHEATEKHGLITTLIPAFLSTIKRRAQCGPILCNLITCITIPKLWEMYSQAFSGSNATTTIHER